MLAVLGGSVTASACTTVIVGSQATTDGSMIVARNDDHSPTTMEYFITHQPGAMDNVVFKDKKNSFDYTMPAKTLGYTTFSDYPNLTKGEVGFNQDGVGVSATETIQASQAALAVDPYLTKTGVGEEAITDIILAQAHTAREGAEILGHIVETTGAGEGFGVAIIDQHDVWYLENGSGHQWVAVRIPRDVYFASGNQTRIHHVDLADTKNYMGSKNLLSFAKQHGLWDGKAPFDFAKAYSSNLKNDAYYNYPRVAEIQHTFSPNQDPVVGLSAPTFLKPTKKISVLDVMHMMANHYQDTHADPYMLQNGQVGNRPISVFRTKHSHLLWTRPNLPQAIGEVEYIALGMTDLSVYIPFYQGTTTYPIQYRTGNDNKIDDHSAMWTYRKLQALVMTNYPLYAPEVKEAYGKLQQQIFAEQHNMEQQYLACYKKDPKQAQQLIQNFENKVVLQGLTLTHQLMDKVLYQVTLNVNKAYSFSGA